jgi:DNA-binding GntR family transcriptional regulator
MLYMLLEIKNMIEQVATETLQEKVYKVVKDSIMRNDLLPGQRLSIDELARGLGVSPTPVREALSRLSMDGLIERDRNRTARVAEITKDDVCQTYEVRKLLEPYAFSLVAKRLSSDHNLEHKLRAVKKEAEEIQKALTNAAKSLTSSQYEVYIGIDLRLQEIILEALGNSLLGKVLSLVGNHSLRIRSFAEAGAKPSRCELCHTINRDHLMIIEALLSEDSEKVQGVVRQHLDNAEERTMQSLAINLEKAG